jgi:hypothetical protein
MFQRPEYLLRNSDGSQAYHSPSWLTSEWWWYCGEFKVTAYQFATEARNDGASWYGDADATVTTDSGVTFNASREFMEDVMMNGTGKPASAICPEGNYISSCARNSVSYNCFCGKGKPFIPNVDDYQVVATHLASLGRGASIYVPGLEDDSDPKGNADFVVRDSGEGLVRDQIDVFTGEGPGILSEQYNDCPGLLYISYQHNVRGVPVFKDTDGVDKLFFLALYQKSEYGWRVPCTDERIE